MRNADSHGQSPATNTRGWLRFEESLPKELYAPNAHTYVPTYTRHFQAEGEYTTDGSLSTSPKPGGSLKNISRMAR